MNACPVRLRHVSVRKCAVLLLLNWPEVLTPDASVRGYARVAASGLRHGARAAGRLAETTRLVGINGIPYEDFFGSVTMSPHGRYLVFDSRDARDTLIRDMRDRRVHERAHRPR